MTLWFALPVTIAVNCWCPPPSRETLDGETETEMLGATDRVTVALPDLVASATLFAVIVTVDVPEMFVGAV